MKKKFFLIMKVVKLAFGHKLPLARRLCGVKICLKIQFSVVIASYDRVVCYSRGGF